MQVISRLNSVVKAFYGSLKGSKEIVFHEVRFHFDGEIDLMAWFDWQILYTW